ncbi:aminotransferase class V-fold PLP-dependent enzyme [Aneurinibacillus aneurinilyticus]|jgi:cysteine desulfurase family protein|uniref:cysteine desulfurase n=1 Tax=Aneurinibacillus aneurinilyticus ATCC 12856 TaxID=649747 RepID=U1WRH6_ANEAE|nr:aminotransferase class V-fold PLP-dependent enzyme [Aneurinibacillus aneurinilyticus]ERI04863.1 cysteine desulfurase family protein [Aneurinibacillus aneurinilyticus ATCC 12856]MCI1693429.1 aminotransferase class V-fold PLP-dependent enzyme [Aneurinibacillus aneurinilyticus]MED0706004.1 aminotransferase class V-fold PLP-dependent enzyme [Aneurinibacillus aneurinilyticus]MED0721657.1 aminotransferase class V-fold PLP-dependent enzyme [Aneurinibacillus aneurinilyticus]MED0730924.1 aminotransf
MRTIYLDNAASTWPKPPEVSRAVAKCIDEYAANPGRGGHKLSLKASKAVYQARVRLARLFNVKNPNDIFFTVNATHALNQAIKGFVKAGDHVITTSLEHNSVRRPLEFLRKEAGVQITYIKPENHQFSLDAITSAIQTNTTMIVVSHASNLLGTIAPVKEIGLIAREAGITYLVDASQTAGILPLDVEEMKIDMLAFPGHKGLYGPQGTGGLYVRSSVELTPLLHGGTGSHSEEIDQPMTRPDRYESGTLNTPGIVGLSAGVDFVLKTGVETIRQKEWTLTQLLLDKLSKVEGVRVFGPDKDIERVGVVPFMLEGVDASELAYILDQEYNIAVRSGFHCTPLAHETAGTSDTGAVRVSFGYFNEEEDIDALIKALQEIKEAFVI